MLYFMFNCIQLAAALQHSVINKEHLLFSEKQNSDCGTVKIISDANLADSKNVIPAYFTS